MCPMSSEPTPEQLAKQQGVPARGASHYAKGTAANMARSLSVLLALTLGLFLVTSVTSRSEPESLDVAAVAEQRADQAGHPLAYAQDLPEGWVATSARYVRSSDDVMMWNAGYTTPDGEHVAVQQALDPPQSWVDTQADHGEQMGSAETDGHAWVKRRGGEGPVYSLVDDPSDASEVTTIVTGTGGFEQLETFADHLVVAEPRSSTPQPSS